MSIFQLYPRYILPWGKQVLKSEDVCLVRTSVDMADPDRNWVKTYWYAICKPEKQPFKGYEVIGRCDLRFGYNKQLYYGGHIGYRIHEPYRGDHMALKAVRVLFKYVQDHPEFNLPYLLITCNPDNEPSRKTLERLTTEYDGRMIDFVDLPPDNDMYKDGDRQKYVFFYPMQEGAEAPTLQSFRL